MSSLRAFEQGAREVEATLSDLRAAQQAYVAEGQGGDFWMPKVSVLTESASSALASLQKYPLEPTARGSLNDAATTLNEFGDVDKRARDYLKGGQQLMAGDVIYTEGSEAAAAAAREVESARAAEQQAFDANEARLRNLQGMAAAGAAALAAFVVLLLMPRPSASAESAETLTSAPARTIAPTPAPAVAPPAPTPASVVTRTLPVLKSAADLATDFGRVRDLDDLRRLLGRAAEIMDASGIIVWMGSAEGADLRAVLAHGYTPQMLARMPVVARSGDNAAAAAYRTGSLQIVLSRPGGTSGAIVAPILAADGCIGALSAEIRGGGETSESVQALATIFAAHLAGVLQMAPADAAETKSAAS